MTKEQKNAYARKYYKQHKKQLWAWFNQYVQKHGQSPSKKLFEQKRLELDMDEACP